MDTLRKNRRRNNRWRLGALLFVILLGAMLVAGCSLSNRTVTEVTPGLAEPPTEEPAPPPVPPSSTKTYAYRVMNDGCDCEEFSTWDGDLEYRFRANYLMDSGILTSITIEFKNEGKDTLFLDRGTLRISSRNVKYQYNNKFLPVGGMVVEPYDSYTLPLQGKEVTTRDDWHKIAGEQLSLTIRGLRLGEKQLKEQSITFIPENPNFQN